MEYMFTRPISYKPSYEAAQNMKRKIEKLEKLGEIKKEELPHLKSEYNKLMKQLSSLELEKTTTLISRKSEVDSLIEKSLNAHKVNNKTENKNLIFCKSYEKENFYPKI